MATTPKFLSYEEWLELPEIGDAIEEVVNGEIRIMPPNKWNHAVIVKKLERQLERHLDPETIYVMTALFGLVIRLEPLTTRAPDLAVFRVNSLVERDGYIHSAPELVVEVLSPGNTRTERASKLKDYESIGVPEVWIVSPEAETIEVLQLIEGKLSTTSISREGQLRPKHFPEAAVDIPSIWPR